VISGIQSKNTKKPVMGEAEVQGFMKEIVMFQTMRNPNIKYNLESKFHMIWSVSTSGEIGL